MSSENEPIAPDTPDSPDSPDSPDTSAAAEDPTQILQKERDDLLGRLQRVSADYQNYMRRSQQFLQDEVERVRGDVLKLFIPILDDFDRALEAEPGDDAARALQGGMRIVRDNLLKTLEQAGVSVLPVQRGDDFDPHCHEALMRQPADDLKSHQVSAVLQAGYRYGSRTLRPAKVAVVP